MRWPNTKTTLPPTISATSETLWLKQNGEDIFQRYQFFSRYEGNSNTQQPYGYPITSTTIPNTEDINEDLTLGTIESYYQYEIPMTLSDLSAENVGKGYLADVLETVSKTNGAGEQRPIKWYQFKIPVREYQQAYNGISDFRSIRFMRMFMQGWSEPVTLAFCAHRIGAWRVAPLRTKPGGLAGIGSGRPHGHAVCPVGREPGRKRRATARAVRDSLLASTKKSTPPTSTSAA